MSSHKKSLAHNQEILSWAQSEERGVGEQGVCTVRSDLNGACELSAFHVSHERKSRNQAPSSSLEDTPVDVWDDCLTQKHSRVFLLVYLILSKHLCKIYLLNSTSRAIDMIKFNFKILLGKKKYQGASLVAQWLKNPPASTGDTGSIPSLGRSHMRQSP